MSELIYCMLQNVKPVGRTIGKFGDRDISEGLSDELGRVYRFVGLASRTMHGNLDPDALKPGEFILKPGLVYRMVLPSRSAFSLWRALKSSVIARMMFQKKRA
jgi:hypothetical protein